MGKRRFQGRRDLDRGEGGREIFLAGEGRSWARRGWERMARAASGSRCVAEDRGWMGAEETALRGAEGDREGSRRRGAGKVRARIPGQRTAVGGDDAGPHLENGPAGPGGGGRGAGGRAGRRRRLLPQPEAGSGGGGRWRLKGQELLG